MVLALSAACGGRSMQDVAQKKTGIRLSGQTCRQTVARLQASILILTDTAQSLLPHLRREPPRPPPLLGSSVLFQFSRCGRRETPCSAGQYVRAQARRGPRHPTTGPAALQVVLKMCSLAQRDLACFMAADNLLSVPPRRGPRPSSATHDADPVRFVPSPPGGAVLQE
jgi:hypothetical protein